MCTLTPTRQYQHDAVILLLLFFFFHLALNPVVMT